MECHLKFIFKDLKIYFVFEASSTDDLALCESENKRMRDEWHFFISKIPIRMRWPGSAVRFE